MPTKQEIQDIISRSAIKTGDIVFQHAIFLQCFLPIRALFKGTHRYQVSHGNATLIIRAGELINPGDFRKTEERAIPSGPKARLLLAYINDQAIRTKNPTIDMGKSLRNFMDKNGIPIGGKNAKEIVEQVKNIAAADILIGVWGEDYARQDKLSIATTISFWIEKDPNQGTFWQPEMTLSAYYMEALQHHRVPLDFRALVGLQANPRAMDLYCWMAYRLHTIKRNPLKISYRDLHSVFGKGIKELRNFKVHFKKAVIEAHKFYPDARIDFHSDKDYVAFYQSPPPVPMKGQVLIGKGLFPKK